jgi:hypothetical protein
MQLIWPINDDSCMGDKVDHQWWDNDTNDNPCMEDKMDNLQKLWKCMRLWELVQYTRELIHLSPFCFLCQTISTRENLWWSTDTSQIRRVRYVSVTVSDTDKTLMITLNYVIFLNYYRCRCVSVCVVSDICVGIRAS